MFPQLVQTPDATLITFTLNASQTIKINMDGIAYGFSDKITDIKAPPFITNMKNSSMLDLDVEH